MVESQQEILEQASRTFIISHPLLQPDDNNCPLKELLSRHKIILRMKGFSSRRLFESHVPLWSLIFKHYFVKRASIIFLESHREFDNAF